MKNSPSIQMKTDANVSKAFNSITTVLKVVLATEAAVLFHTPKAILVNLQLLALVSRALSGTQLLTLVRFSAKALMTAPFKVSQFVLVSEVQSLSMQSINACQCVLLTPYRQDLSTTTLSDATARSTLIGINLRLLACAILAMRRTAS